MAKRAGRRASRWKTFKEASIGRKIWVVIKTLFLLGIVSMLLAALGLVLAYFLMPIPDPNAGFQSNNTTIYYRDGKEVLATLSVQNRVSVPYSEMSQSIKDAVVAAENRSFWEDPGFDLLGIGRAFISNVAGSKRQGGSTITQQYVKIMYLNSNHSYIRKLKELIISLKIGNELNKTQILERYLNTIYFGRGAYGIEAAAKSWFGVSAKDLNIEQAAVLAAVLNYPSGMDPENGKESLERLTKRYEYVINALAETKKITPEQKTKALKGLPEIKKPVVDKNKYNGPNGFVINTAETQLTEVLKELGYEEAEIEGGGFSVTTTFDKTKQDALNQIGTQQVTEIAKKVNRKPEELDLGVASVDTKTGAVLAIYGGLDFIKDSRNWATTPRPVGSTFKAFTLAAALNTKPFGTFTLDTKLKGNTWTPPGDSAPVKNAFGKQFGQEITLDRAMQMSSNTALVDLSFKIPGQADTIAKMANSLGVPSGQGWDLNNRLTLGFAEANTVNMAAAYATFANGGERNTKYYIEEIKDRKGNVIYKAKTNPIRVLDPEVNNQVNKSLVAVNTTGLSQSVNKAGFLAGGKTGTVSMFDRDVAVWYVGYTKQISTAVMFVSGKDGTGDVNVWSPSGYFSSGIYPPQVWIDYMKEAMKDLPQEPLVQNIKSQESTADPMPNIPSFDKEPESHKPTQTLVPHNTVSATPEQQPSASATPRPRG